MILGIIPARYSSQRFPGKVLAKIDDKTVIQHVYERARRCTALDRLVVATDDQRVHAEVISFGGECLMTSEAHRNGTERCAEVAKSVAADHYVNIQGDEPLIEPAQIQAVCQLLKKGASIATLKKEIKARADLADPNIVKVVTSLDGNAMYFSRSWIPFDRMSAGTQYFRHIGLYGFQAGLLPTLVALPPTPLEQSESLEQLRWLENGYVITVGTTDYESHGVDTPEDLQRIQAIVNERKDT